MGTSWNTEAIKLYAYQLGKNIGRLRAFKGKPAPYCLFNGVKLKQLPELDEDFPYLIIRNGGLGMYQLRCSNVPWIHRISETCTNAGGQYISCALARTSDDWGTMSEPTDGGMVTDVIWTNTDILTTDGSVWMEASDPVPVYE